LCLSYLTIENRGDIPEEAAQKMGETFYGCDRCQQVCPWNAKAKPTAEPLLQPTSELLSMKDEDWQQLSVEQYRKLFKGSAVKRAKYEGLMRNIKAIRNEQDK
jgi:epoxyqueuosine reductase